MAVVASGSRTPGALRFGQSEVIALIRVNVSGFRFLFCGNGYVIVSIYVSVVNAHFTRGLAIGIV